MIADGISIEHSSFHTGRAQHAVSFAIMVKARVLGFEPRIVVPKTTALPLGHTRTSYEERLGGNPQLCIARLV